MRSLYLNVYAPPAATATPKPVILWIFGGGFQGGGGNETRLNGTWDVEFEHSDVVVVTFNYRLNVFGFLAMDDLRSRDSEGSTGNYGIQDQVRNNSTCIKLFIRPLRRRLTLQPRPVLARGARVGAELHPRVWGRQVKRVRCRPVCRRQ